VSELEAHQTICLVLGTISGVCLTSFFITLNPIFALANILLISKVLRGMQRYYDDKSCRKNGRELMLHALLRFF
jgi:hypothetical protein